MKRFYHTELEHFRADVILMGEHAIEQVQTAVEGLEELDPQAAAALADMDERIDDLEEKINAEVLRYISLRSPVATELRLLSIGVKAAAELERVGDEAVTIAKQGLELIQLGVRTQPVQLQEMAESVVAMLRDVLSAFISEDIAAVEGIRARDKAVDSMHRGMRALLRDSVQGHSLPLEAVFPLIFISKSLERIGDHAKNLAGHLQELYRGRDTRPPR